MTSKKFGKLIDLEEDDDEYVEILVNDTLGKKSSSNSSNGKDKKYQQSQYDMETLGEYYNNDSTSESDHYQEPSTSGKKSRGGLSAIGSILFGGNSAGGSNNERSSSSNNDSKKKGSAKQKKDLGELTTKQSEIDKTIGNLLATIEKPWQHYDTTTTAIMEGELLKKSRFSSGWKKYHFALNGNNLYYYKTKSSKKPKGIISISFVTPPIVMSERNLVEIRSPHVSNYQIQLYSNKRIDQLCALSNEDFERWNDVLQNLMRSNLDTDDYENRLAAWNQVYPLFDKKTELELDRLLLLLAEIDSYSTHLINKSKKEKTGNLLMMEEDDDSGKVTWKNYYFSLLDKCLYYYKSSKLPPQGVITLKYTDVTICNASESNSNYDLSFSFKLSTPLSVFILKAKHQVAMEDWVNALEFSKSGKKINGQNFYNGTNSPILNNPIVSLQQPSLNPPSYQQSQSQSQSTLSSSPNQSPTINNNINNSSNSNLVSSIHNIHLNSSNLTVNNQGTIEEEAQMFVSGYGKKFIPTLTYTVFGTSKQKVSKLSLGSHTIGRSESCNITIDDKKVSRTHCKIEVSDSQCLIMDLGSGHGTKVNKKVIDKHSLLPGDRIKIGKTQLRFEAVKK